MYCPNPKDSKKVQFAAPKIIVVEIWLQSIFRTKIGPNHDLVRIRTKVLFLGPINITVFGFLVNLIILFWIIIPTFECLFYKTFLFEASLYMFWFFGTLGALFWVWFLVFENFEIVIWIRIPTFGGSVL